MFLSYDCITRDTYYTAHRSQDTAFSIQFLGPRSLPPHLLLSLLQHLLRRHRSKPGHNLQILLLAHLLIALADLRQYLEVVDVEGGCESVEELCLFVRRVGEGVWCADGYSNVVANVGIVLGAVGGVEL
jgi:hypothetical protein